ncbi:ionotropic receptor 21a-like [Scylla paramamosain]|uniref:ionotropic receptor 21a-like n=1 Tax=Scylla paramamosain TaxID=85552 RepID=UPI003082C0CF
MSRVGNLSNPRKSDYVDEKKGSTAHSSIGTLESRKDTINSGSLTVCYYSFRHLQEMVQVLGGLLWVSVTAATFVTRSLPPSFPSAERKDYHYQSYIKTGGYEDVLWPRKDAASLRCNLIVFMDGESSSSVLHQLMWSRGEGSVRTAVFEVINKMGANHTHSLIPWVAHARQLRASSWCLTIAVVSDDQAFLTAFAEVSDKARLIVWETRLLVVTKLAIPRLRSLLRDYWDFSMMNTQFLKPNDISKKGWKAFVYLPYSQDGGQVVRVASWKQDYGLVLANGYTLFPDKYKNFYGKAVNMTVFPFPPYWMDVTSGDDAKESRITGRDYIILETIAQKLNFSINVLPYGEWDEVMMRLEVRTALMSPIKLAILPNLLKKYDFSFFIEPATLGFSMGKPTLKPNWQSLYYPLQTEVWGSILAAVLLVFGALLLMVKHSGDSEKYQVWPVVKQVVGTLLDETISGKLPQRNSTRVVLTAWMIFSFIVGTVYRSNLTACLTVPKYPPRAETLKQLVESEAIVTTPPDMVDFVNNFKNSGSKLFKTVADRTKFVPSFEIGMREAIDSKKAYLYERLNMKLLIAEHFTGKGGSTPLYVARQNILPGYCGWPLAPNTPFKTNLNEHILAFHEAGLIQRWTTEVLERAQFDSQRRQNRAAKENNIPEEEEVIAGAHVTMALTLVHMQGPLFLFLIGACLSLAVFLGEISVSFCHLDRGTIWLY